MSHTHRLPPLGFDIFPLTLPSFVKSHLRLCCVRNNRDSLFHPHEHKPERHNEEMPHGNQSLSPAATAPSGTFETVEKPLLLAYVSANAARSEGNSLESSSSVSPRDSYDFDNIKTCDSTRTNKNSRAAFLG